MSATVAIGQTIIWAGDSDHPHIETEIFAHQILAKSVQISDWAEEHAEDAHEQSLALLREYNYKPGVYYVMGLWKLTGGKDRDTPDGPGEFWSHITPSGELEIDRLSETEAPEIAALFYKDAAQFLFDLEG